MRPELVIAERELREHFSSKRFLIILCTLVLLMIFSLWTGLDEYNQQLSDYKSAMGSAGSSPGQPSPSTTSMPSVLQVFQNMVTLFTLMGMMLGVSLGFDAISRERDKGSIKFLVSSPIYRDAIINGKTIGALATLAVTIGAVFLIALAVMVLNAVIPSVDELLRIACFFLAALLYCMVFFAISLMMSTLTKDTATSIVCAFWLVLLLIVFSSMSLQVASTIAGVLYGPQPYVEQGQFTTPNGYADYINYISRVYQISDSIDIISPYSDFGGKTGAGTGGIGSTLVSLTPTDTSSRLTGALQNGYSLADSILHVLSQLLALIVELVVSFCVSYVAFMRMDIR